MLLKCITAQSSENPTTRALDIRNPSDPPSKPPELLPAQPMGASLSRPPDLGANDTSRNASSTSLPNTERQPLPTTLLHPNGPRSDPAPAQPSCLPSKEGQAHPKPKAPDSKSSFAISCILDKQKRQGVWKYRIRWEPSWVRFDAVHEGNEGKYVVIHDGKFWEAEKLEEKVRGGVDGWRVQWKSTWEPLGNINPSEDDKVAAFEAGWAKRSRSRLSRIRYRQILTIAQSNFPEGRLLPQSDEDYAAAQQHVAKYWPEIRPHATLDLYPAIYCIQLELLGGEVKAKHGGKSFHSLLSRRQVRPLVWRTEYVDSGRTYTFRRRRRSALIIQVTGLQSDHDRCLRCSGDDDLVVPFVECVRSEHSQGTWHGDSCPNCAIQNSSDCLHYTGAGTQGEC